MQAMTCVRTVPEPNSGVTTPCRVTNRPVLDQLRSIASIEQFPRQTAVLWESEPAECVFEVTKGVLKLSKMLPDGRRQIVGFLYPGHVLGLAVDGQYTYTAETLTEVEAFRYPRSRLDQLVDETPSVGQHLLALTSDELRAAQDQMLLLGRKTAREKVASFLLMMCERSGGGDGFEDSVHLPMNRVDIADYLGLTMETVSRILGELKREQVIDLKPHRVDFLRPGILREMAEGEGSHEPEIPAMRHVKGRAAWPN